MLKRLIKIMQVVVILFTFTSCSYGLIELKPNLQYSDHLKSFIDRLHKESETPAVDWDEQALESYLINYSLALDLALNYHYEIHDKSELEKYVEEAVQANLYSKNHDIAKIIELATETIFEKLDKNSRFLSVKGSKLVTDQIDTGIFPYNRAKFEMTDQGLVITGFYPYSPLLNSELEILDTIVKVNGMKVTKENRSLINIIFYQAKQLNLTVIKKDGSLKEVVISDNDKLVDEENYVRSKVITSKGKNILYVEIDLFAFMPHEIFLEQYSKLRESLKESNATDFDAIIFDLRDNPGGVTYGAAIMADWFFPKDVKYFIYEARGTTYPIESEEDQIFSDDIQLVILINKNSASASEALTKVLVAQRDAVVIGEKSYGKATSQSAFAAKLDRIFLFSTDKFTAYGENNNFLPINPDFNIVDDLSTPDNDEVLDFAIDKIHSLN